jgi:hypothetical protein
VKAVLKILSMILVEGGLGLLGWGVLRHRLPYENDRYFDPQTAVVYHQQTAEAYLVVGVALTQFVLQK